MVVTKNLAPSYPCKAKNPSVCPYHGPFLRLETAIENNDFNAYEKAKTEVLEAQKNKRKLKKVEEIQPSKDQITPPKFSWGQGRFDLLNNESYIGNLNEQYREEKEAFRTRVVEDPQQIEYVSKVTGLISNGYVKDYEKLEAKNDSNRVDLALKMYYSMQILNAALSRKCSLEEFKDLAETSRTLNKKKFDDTWGSLSRMSKFNGGNSPEVNLRAIEQANAYNAFSDVLKALDK